MKCNVAKNTIGETLERELLTKDDMKYFKKQHETEDDDNVVAKMNTTKIHPFDKTDKNNEGISKAKKSIYYLTK